MKKGITLLLFFISIISFSQEIIGDELLEKKIRDTIVTEYEVHKGDCSIAINEIKIPKIRAWYYNKNNGYLGTDILTKK